MKFRAAFTCSSSSDPTSLPSGPSEPKAAARSTTETYETPARTDASSAAGNGRYVWTRTTRRSSSPSSSSCAVSPIDPIATSAVSASGLPTISSAPTFSCPKCDVNSDATVSTRPLASSIASATLRWNAK